MPPDATPLPNPFAHPVSRAPRSRNPATSAPPVDMTPPSARPRLPPRPGDGRSPDDQPPLRQVGELDLGAPTTSNPPEARQGGDGGPSLHRCECLPPDMPRTHTEQLTRNQRRKLSCQPPAVTPHRQTPVLETPAPAWASSPSRAWVSGAAEQVPSNLNGATTPVVLDTCCPRSLCHLGGRTRPHFQTLLGQVVSTAAFVVTSQASVTVPSRIRKMTISSTVAGVR